MDSSLPALVLAVVLVASAVGAGVVLTDGFGVGSGSTVPDDGPSTTGSAELSQFDSEAAFVSYVRRAQSHGGGVFLGGATMGRPAVAEATADGAQTAGTGSKAGGSAGGDGGDGPRVSGTNVQEAGIDEPDQLKVAPDGRTMYYASGYGYWAPGGEARVLDTSDPAAPAVVQNVYASGKLLLVDETLVVVGQQSITGFDVSDRSSPRQRWQTDLNARVESARLLDGRLVLVLRQGVDLSNPCPIQPFAGGPGVPCTDIYHPVSQTGASVTYTTAVVDPHSGETFDSVTFLGTYGQSATYVSNDAVYLTYTKQPDYAATFGDYLRSSDLLDSQARARLDELDSYDLSPQARQVELGAAVQDWLARQPAEKRVELQQRLYEGYRAYVDAHKRELLQSGIVKVAIDDDSLSVVATGQVPGRPLNQWAMDEHDGRLRIATTVDPWGANSTNDLYTLNEDLTIAGSVRDMGVNEHIYSVRFMDDSAYVVTFREIDPFYTIDLSDHANPEVRGEVKLPGFSRYLHPLSDDRMLGIGQEDGRVKATVFDVTDPDDPTVVESRVLDARWSAVARSHHAFLYDADHGVFFLPTERGGYVFGEDLSKKAFVETASPATRAAYLGDYLYVFSDSGLVVVDEDSWESVAEVKFDTDYQREKNDQSASDASGADGAV
ncbi:beta-propeller domain-containing protein [Haloarchaeobius sp. TZWWS8]|uniref:beta-propeller domain-containing protein n=1 Tax=Haloarchaeobius sp. TZWWS8 TaxID=3446121 RepID=UPI003EBE6FA7